MTTAIAKGKNTLLTDEEVKELIAEAQAGSEEAMDTIVAHNTRLVWNVIWRYQNKGHDLDDLYQEGVIGLVKAIQRFDLNIPVKFSTYAVPMIQGEVRRYIRDTDIVNVSRNIKDISYQITKQKLHEHSIEEISEIVNQSESLVADALEYLQRGGLQIDSVNKVVFNQKDGDEITLGDMMSGDVNPENWFEHIALHEAVKRLNDREKEVIQLRFLEDLTQVETSKKLGVSQVHVSRLERRALKELKRLMEPKEEEKVAMEPKTEEVKVKEETKPVKKSRGKGNREEAIKLLATTEKSLKEISKETGVPMGTLGYLSREHRPKHVRKANMVKPKHGKPKEAQKKQELNKAAAEEEITVKYTGRQIFKNLKHLESELTELSDAIEYFEEAPERFGEGHSAYKTLQNLYESGKMYYERQLDKVYTLEEES